MRRVWSLVLGWWMLMFILPILVVVTAMNGKGMSQERPLVPKGRDDLYGNAFKSDSATVDKTSLEIKYKAGENKLKVDVGSFGGVVPTNLAGGIQELDEGGVSGYKCFLGTCGDRSIEGDFQNVDDYSLYEE